jgi:predicted nucleic acid-binding protein
VQSRRRERVIRLLHEIRTLTVELEAARRAGESRRRLRRKERALERLRWQLAAVARRAAMEEAGAA